MDGTLFFKFSLISDSIIKVYDYYQKSEHWKKKITIEQLQNFHSITFLSSLILPYWPA